MAVNEVTSVDVKALTPFKRFIMTLGELPTSYLESMSYAELVMWFCNFLQEKVIPTVNNNADALQDVIHYLETLDLQDEVDHKLDEMAEDGTLQEIIADYLNSKAIFAFDTVADLKSATNLIDGSYAKTLGYHSINDNGGALYKIRKITNDDIIDEGSIIALNDDNLIAELIIEDKVNVLNFGYTLESITFDGRTANAKNITTALKNAITFINSRETNKGNDGGTIGIQIYFPDEFYYINDTINLDSKEISLIGDSPAIKRVDFRIGNYRSKILTNVDGSVFSNGRIHFKGLNFENIMDNTTASNNLTFTTATIQSMRDCQVNNYDIVITSLGGVATVDSNYFLNCRKYFCNGNLSDSIVTNNYINAHPSSPNTVCFNSTTIGMSLISGNFIDFFKQVIICSTQTTGVRIVDNTFDYIYKVIDIGGASGVTISNNSFNHISKTYYERLGYQDTDPEASADWICIETRYTITGLTISGNTVENYDKFINIPHLDGNSSICCIGNIMSDFTKYGSIYSGVNNNKIKIYDLNEKEYSVEPTKWNTYTNQKAYYNGFIYKNVGNIVKCIGTTQLLPAINKNYTASGGGTTTFDFANALNSGILCNVKIEVNTTRGYYTPKKAIFNITKIGGSLVITELFNNSDTDYKINATSSGTTLTISFSGSVEEDTSTSKQIIISNYE